MEDEGLGDRDAIAIGPGQRHAQFVLAGRELVLSAQRLVNVERCVGLAPGVDADSPVCST